jgi:hypothetical protein
MEGRGAFSFQEPGSGGFPAPFACSTDEGPVTDGPLRCCTFASMGFLDKAKKLAEQAQTKLDEVQGQYNQQSTAPSGPVTEYDKHGRPVPPAATTGSAPPPAPPAPPTPGVPPTGSPATPPVEAAPSAPAPPPVPGAPPVEEDRNHPSYTPPPLTSGDPLAG